MPNRPRDDDMDSGDRAPRRVPEKHFGRDEYLVHMCRSHVVVLELPTVVWFVTGALFLVALTDSGQSEGVVKVIALAAFVAGSGFFAGNVAAWWMKRYVLTNFRVLVIEGVFSRRVTALPLRMVIDTSYHRTLMGRLMGYGDLELNLSGQPALRTLTTLPRPDEMYHSIVYLVGPGGSPGAS